ncbi:MAG: type II toxin-antitoxin system RelE/ParE family toxin [Ideonella sp.]|nr:type II toxin-antitoxin system RelE/ParE family toxin [Ideonella sp.]
MGRVPPRRRVRRDGGSAHLRAGACPRRRSAKAAAAQGSGVRAHEAAQVSVVRLSPRARIDLDRITDHLLAHEVTDVEARMSEILDALQLLALHPRIGRPATAGLRELVIGRGSRGYVALYGYDDARDEVLVAALRGQREAGYSGG